MRCDGWSVSLVLGAWLLVEEKRLWRKFFFFLLGGARGGQKGHASVKRVTTFLPF